MFTMTSYMIFDYRFCVRKSTLSPYIYTLLHIINDIIKHFDDCYLFLYSEEWHNRYVQLVERSIGQGITGLRQFMLAAANGDLDCTFKLAKTDLDHFCSRR